MDTTSAQARDALRATQFGLPVPPACEYHGEPDDTAEDRAIDDVLAWLYPAAPEIEAAA